MSPQQYFSNKGTSLPVLNQYQARINVLAQGHNCSDVGEAQNPRPLGLELSTQSLSHCAPLGQMYCRMLQREHSAILLTFVKLQVVIKTFFVCFE